MKYNKELTEKLSFLYSRQKLSVPEIAKVLGDEVHEIIPERSIIAKLSSLGIYQKKQYLTKRGEIPVRKSEYIEKIAKILEVDVESLESMEKLNKSVLVLLLDNLEVPDPNWNTLGADIPSDPQLHDLSAKALTGE
jgi:hypothetical protein